MLKQHCVTIGVKDKIWAQEDIAALFNRGMELLVKPQENDIPSSKERKLNHHDGTELLIVEREDKVILMLPDEFSEYGAPIVKYTSAQAIDDGVLMKNPAMDIFTECNIITTNLFEYCKKRAFEENIMKDEFDLVKALMIAAKDIYENNKFQGDNDKDFFAVKGNEKVKDVWFCRNEYGRLTAMLPDDY